MSCLFTVTPSEFKFLFFLLIPSNPMAQFLNSSEVFFCIAETENVFAAFSNYVGVLKQANSNTGLTAF